jgi:hypothetical protein
MLNKILFVILLGAIAGLSPVSAQTTPTASGKIRGQILAARVEGHVDAVSKADGSTRVLHDGDSVTDQTQIVTAKGASVILVFSNGATVNVAGDSSLDINEFEQDPFAAEKIADMTQEPGTSITKLNLTKGELVGKVVHLNVDRGSEFTVQTPVGAAGIRGTVFRIIFRNAYVGTPPTLQTLFSLQTQSGRVLFTGTSAIPLSIPAGKQVTAYFNYTPPTSTSPAIATPVAPTLGNLQGFVLGDINIQDSAQIEAATQVIVATTSPTIFTPAAPPSDEFKGNGTNNTNNLPSQPTIPLIPQP